MVVGGGGGGVWGVVGERQPSSFQGINRLKSHECCRQLLRCRKNILIAKKAVCEASYR